MEPVLTRNIVAHPATTWIADYEANGGYQALRKALGMAPADVVKLVSDSGLRGRGGAGFPTGRKWASMPPPDSGAAPDSGGGFQIPPQNREHPRYLICNFDEMEPGTFKDRFLVEGDPHQLIEGLLIAGYACQADIGYVFLRLEYCRIEDILLRAFTEAREKGYIGSDILGSGWSFELHIHTSAGRYMSGEETGLLNALEGRPANPRSKPPYPGTSGVWGKPTIVQNVETLCCVPHIVERGADWFKGLGKAKDSGTKIYGASGKVKHPGCWELPMGSTLREIIELAGGMRDGFEFRAALPGGASTVFLDATRLDTPLDFDSLKEIGAYMGTGTAIVLDDKTCPVAVCRNLMAFYARESCGWCTPCREGLPWLEEILNDIENGRGEPGDIDNLLLRQASLLGPNTYCALAMGAVLPLVSAIELFREDFEEHIRGKACPYKGRTCQ